MLNEYHEQRAKELGLQLGTGKQYTESDLEAFGKSTFIGRIYTDGVLNIDEEYFKGVVDKFRKTHFVPRKGKTERPVTLETKDHFSNLETFAKFAGFFDKLVPASWVDSKKIVKDLRMAKKEGVQLPPVLIRFGIVYPFTEVRTTLYESQALTDKQKTLIGFMGISPKHPDSGRLQNLAMMTMFLMPQTFAEEFSLEPRKTP